MTSHVRANSEPPFDFYEIGLLPNSLAEAGNNSTKLTNYFNQFPVGAGIELYVPEGRWELAEDLAPRLILKLTGAGRGLQDLGASLLSFAAGKGIKLGTTNQNDSTGFRLQDLVVVSRATGGPLTTLVRHDVGTIQGSTTITSSTGFTADMVGREIIASNVPLGTTLVSQAGGTAVMSAAAATTKSGRTVAFYNPATSGIEVSSGLGLIERVTVYNFQGHGICLNGSGETRNANLTEVRGCRLDGNAGLGLMIRTGLYGANACTFDHLDCTGNGAGGIYNSGAKHSFSGVTHVDYNYGYGVIERGPSSTWECLYTEGSNPPHGPSFVFGQEASSVSVWTGGYGGATPVDLNSNNMWYGQLATQSRISVATHSDPNNPVLQADGTSDYLRLGRNKKQFTGITFYSAHPALDSGPYAGAVAVPNLAAGTSFTFEKVINASDANELVDFRDVVMGTAITGAPSGVTAIGRVTSSATQSKISITIKNETMNLVTGWSTYWTVFVAKAYG